MNEEQVEARGAIEALRSGVPSRHAVRRLGTTQEEIDAEFERRLDEVEAGGCVEPLVFSANFGAGKSHLLNHLSVRAADRRFVHAYLVVSPETPPGNPHLVLKAIADAAEAPGREGPALEALTSDLHTDSKRYADLRLWVRDAGLNDRFAAILLLYEEFAADEEFRLSLLRDLQGDPVKVMDLRQRLKEIKQASGFDLRGQKQALLAHDRIRLLARFFRMCTGKGLVVFFDEMERLAVFPSKQRHAAWQELGWWRQLAQEEGSGIVPVFAIASGLLDGPTKTDTDSFRDGAKAGQSADEQRLALAGIEMLERPLWLGTPTAEQRQSIELRVKSLYEEAYGVQTAPLEARRDVATTIRSEIRRWITLWDMQRYYPQYEASLVERELLLGASEIPETAFASDDENGGE